VHRIILNTTCWPLTRWAVSTPVASVLEEVVVIIIILINLEHSCREVCGGHTRGGRVTDGQESLQGQSLVIALIALPIMTAQYLTALGPSVVRCGYSANDRLFIHVDVRFIPSQLQRHHLLHPHPPGLASPHDAAAAAWAGMTPPFIGPPTIITAPGPISGGGGGGQATCKIKRRGTSQTECREGRCCLRTQDFVQADK
jgi:hypothetical protein